MPVLNTAGIRAEAPQLEAHPGHRLATLWAARTSDLIGRVENSVTVAIRFDCTYGNTHLVRDFIEANSGSTHLFYLSFL